MSISANVRERLLNSFRAELQEHLQTMTDGLLALEQQTIVGDARQATHEDIFRAAHSLKGAARAIGVTMVEQLAHALEDVLDALRHAKLAPTADLYTGCYQALDAIQEVHTAYEAGAITPPVAAMQALLNLQHLRDAAPAMAAPAIATPASPVTAEASIPEPEASGEPTGGEWSGGDETIRVKVNKLDALLAQLSELMVTKIRAEQRLTQLRQIEEDISLWQKNWLGVRSVYSRLTRQNEGRENQDMARLLNFVGGSQEQLRELNARVSTLSREYASDTLQMALVIDELEAEVKRVRMLPLSTITGPFGRMVRDLAHAAGKQALFRIEGGETELDKRVLEQIKDPLIHLLRNAVDHGLETPEVRRAAGKPPLGSITLKAEQVGKDIVLSVRDDGAGLDLEAVRATIARHDPIGAQTLNEAELKAAIFNVGISTSAVITDISGRGVGLDVVRRNVEALHGRIEVGFTPGQGAAFTLTLPLTLSSSRGLLVQVSGERFAIPLTNIERIHSIAREDVTTLGGFDAVHYGDRVIPLVHLADVLELSRNGTGQAGHLPFVVLAFAERRVAFVVDQLAVEQEIVMKGLGKQLQRVGGIAGATVLGSGEIVLILNVADIVKMALRGHHQVFTAESAHSEAAGKQRNGYNYILIVDDSITTRTLEKNILEAAGYRVKLATDGQEAWELIAAGEAPDLVVSDVSMPRLDGIGLTQRIKGDHRTAEVPVILVTSLDSPKDKARGIDAGADAYITKGAFDQNNLLETIEQLI